MERILQSSATAMAAAIQNKEISSVELVDLLLQHIEAINPKINAIVQLNVEQTREAAKQCDALLAQGKTLGPFHGVPFTAKDIYQTKGMITTFGTLGLRYYSPKHSATIIEAAKNAGAVLLGKTNIPEFCIAAETDNLVYGVTKNPYHLNHSAGGSSGGEAAIIAACGSPFGIGSDLAGSLRIPAHYCGVASIRPTVGRVPCAHNFRGLSNSTAGVRVGIEGAMCADGPMARYVEDLYPILKAISKPDGVDPNAINVPLNDPKTVDIKKLKIAYYTTSSILPANDEVQKQVNQVVKSLQELGIEVTPIEPKFMEQALELLIELIASSSILNFLEDNLSAFGTQTPSGLLLKFLQRLRQAVEKKYSLAATWMKWDYYRSAVTEMLFPYDAVIAPVLPFSAITLEESLFDDQLFPALSYCVCFSLAKYPAVTLRVGQSQKGLPIGLQIVSKPWHEENALAIAQHIEKSFGGWKPPTFQS